MASNDGSVAALRGRERSCEAALNIAHMRFRSLLSVRVPRRIARLQNLLGVVHVALNVVNDRVDGVHKSIDVDQLTQRELADQHLDIPSNLVVASPSHRGIGDALADVELHLNHHEHDLEH